MTLGRSAVGLKYLMVPNRETVTVNLMRVGGVQSVSIGMGAWKKAPDRHLAEYSGLEVQGNEMTWCITDVLLKPNGEDREIRAQDTITDGNNITYIVQHAKTVLMGTRWECVCRRK